ncbi:MAG: xanthine dehydrogenase family protein molybdopterin-binding subunit, partial [Vicinamibacterales bacterium]
RVTKLDLSAALAMPGVKAILTADDLPTPGDSMTDGGGVIKANPLGERALTMEPKYEGEPILAVAAVDELTAVEAIERIQIEFEPLPFAVDPLLTLRPDGPNPRMEGNVWVRPPAGADPTRIPTIEEIKWTEEEFADYDQGKLPMGKVPDEWSYGDLDAGFKNAALVLDETFVTADNSHQPLETRSAMAYWQNGKLYMHCSSQSTAQTVPAVARWLGMEAKDVVVISEYTGGGFGSKVTSGLILVVPALLAKKAGAPVMLRITREEEHFIGRARPSQHGRLKLGLSKEGRILAADMFIVVDNGPYEPVNDPASAGRILSLLYQPQAMRWRAVTVVTNTPPRAAQSSPGGMQASGLMEPILSKAARQLGIDHVAIHRINAPVGKALMNGPNAKGVRAHVTSAFVQEALDKGAEIFRWNDRKDTAKRSSGTKVRGVGVALGAYSGGTTGFDALFVIKPDGYMYVQSGIGNLGTESMIDVHRVAAEMMGMPWEKVVITWGNTAKNLPWSCISGGSQTIHAMTRCAHAAASDAIAKAREIAAKTFGGRPEDYTVANERVSGRGRSLTLAEVAQKAIELGGAFDGHELPKNINAFTVTSATALAGQGLMGVAKDTYPRDGVTHSYVAGFAEVEVDRETGKYTLLDYLAVADVGTVVHPRAFGGQVLGRSILGMGHALAQKWVYDQQYGVALARRFYQNRPPSILDVPPKMQWEAVNIPDPETPVGARGIGEPPVGAGLCAILNALSDALGDDIYRRAPVTLDMILTSLEAGRPVTDPLRAHI